MNYASSHYDRTAWFYEKAAHIYSAGAIRRSKVWQLQFIESGDNVLFVGAGSGEDVVLAAQKGAEVTVVELSKNMLKSLDRRLESMQLRSKVNLIQGDAFQYRPIHPYDSVVANYFLNVFKPIAMQEMFKHLSSLLKDKGRFFIADFAIPKSIWLLNFLHNTYYYAALSAFHLIANNPFHAIYDYRDIAAENRFILEKQAGFRVLPGLPPWYQSYIFRRI